MKTFYIALTVLVFLIAQAVLAHRIAWGPIEPDFIILITIFLALYRGGVQGALFGFAIGLLQDLGNPEMLGLNAMTKSILGYLIGRAGEKTFPESALFLFALFFSAAIGHDILYLAFYQWPHIGSALLTIVSVALPSAVYTAALGVAGDKLVSAFGAKAVTTFGKERH